jgi:hypothetical protein
MVNDPYAVDESATEKWLDSWTGSATERAAQAQALADQVAELSASASTPDGAVEVTVNGAGLVTDLRLGELVRKWPSDEISAQILSVMRGAQATLASRVAEVAERTVGTDSGAGRAVIAAFEERFPVVEAEATQGSASDWRRRG